ncbi:phosphatidate cytidylyltransferase [Halomonas urumqiensis]|uniref:Phosphatidate cytidylyltransferase n=1 Tax=Halomonas urumqiensis TaxID=1684789 RepID=A0A2N7UIQ3_9GAMM|nr:phosphatidate cytidylyltransferase [Halomonas urumqiensis]PMR80324.1 phosphatidate cytidylyltransferase [Halomonas urumqiensis]PTB01571.1 phosphatidate cytidylyltransferase [Halomonas urumqiensis]GHE22342.1 phosphatidate cytidylyltransferase [Halomonas urumqiensis]
MLRQRIITAAWLAPLMLAGLFGLSGGAFVLFTALVVLLAGWEWTNLAGVEDRDNRILLVGALALLMAVIWAMGASQASWPLWLAAIGWLANLYWVVHYPEKVHQWQSTRHRLAMGLWVLVPTWVGFNLLRDTGAVWLLYVLLLVWCADIGAYFAGRAFGKRKLAPRVSPGKSWEGVVGGMLATTLLALLFATWQELGFGGGVVLVMATWLVSLVSVLGDLLESMLKRLRGIKDSSQLLPGHGGVLDRIDSLTAAVPLFALLSLGVL